MSLVPLDDARAHVLAHCPPLPTERRPVPEALGSVLAEEVVATEALPPFDNTAVDGFAVRAADTTGATPDRPARLAVVDTVTAGRAPTVAVRPGTSVRIMTGAPMPPDADAVVMVERTRVEGGPEGGEQVLVEVAVEPGANVRRAGDDLRPGDRALDAGTVIGPAHLGVLASLGREDVTVVRRARVGVFSTGDELVVGGGPLAPGQIRDSNRPALLAAVREAGAEPVDLGCLPDDEAVIEAAIREGAATCDALLSSGGVSMGDVDLVKVVLDRLGDLRWMQIAIKPAKPFAFGVVPAAGGASPGEADGAGGRAVPVFGLPGNPVSSLVSFELLARPALRQLMGHRRLDRRRVRAVAEAPFTRRPDGKTHFFRVRCEPADEGRAGFVARPAAGQGSHQLAALAGANGLAVVPDGDGIPAGAEVDVLLLS